MVLGERRRLREVHEDMFNSILAFGGALAQDRG